MVAYFNFLVSGFLASQKGLDFHDFFFGPFWITLLNVLLLPTLQYLCLNDQPEIQILNELYSRVPLDPIDIGKRGALKITFLSGRLVAR